MALWLLMTPVLDLGIRPSQPEGIVALLTGHMIQAEPMTGDLELLPEKPFLPDGLSVRTTQY